MRLNKVIKAKIVENWVKAKWGEKLKLAHDELKADLRRVFECEHPKGFAVAKAHPELHGFMGIYEYFSVNYQVADLCRFAQDHSLDSVDCPKYASTNRYSGSTLTLNTSLEDIHSATKSYNKVTDVFFEQRTVLESLLASVTTVKKLSDLMPEIEKYIPESESVGTQLIDAGAIVKLKLIL